LGGTMDKAAFLSKKALLRTGANPDRRYRDLEEKIRNSVNALHIGPGGLGGDNTCLGAAIETYPTHIAGLPLAVTVNCHAERRATVVVPGGYDGEA
ncbi:MAG: fumarate hydratase, partial [Bullifex sp.]